MACRTLRASIEAWAASAVESCSILLLPWWYVVSRRVLASADRTRSTALRCTRVRIHETALPLAWSNRLAVRQISRKASWATSSAWLGSRTTRTASPNARAAVASYSRANAASSPRPESLSSSARSSGGSAPAAAESAVTRSGGSEESELVRVTWQPSQIGVTWTSRSGSLSDSEYPGNRMGAERRKISDSFISQDVTVASYTVNPDAVAHAERLIRNRQYVLDSDWGDAQPGAD